MMTNYRVLMGKCIVLEIGLSGIPFLMCFVPFQNSVISCAPPPKLQEFFILELATLLRSHRSAVGDFLGFLICLRQEQCVFLFHLGASLI